MRQTYRGAPEDVERRTPGDAASIHLAPGRRARTFGVMADRKEPGRPDEDEDEPGWVSALVSVAGAIGMNRVRVRWKLRRWLRRRRETGNRVSSAVSHVRYQHRVCGHCTAVNDRAEATCQRCGRPLDVRAVELVQRVGLPVPRGTPTTLLAASLLAVFVASVIAQSLGTAFEIDSWSLADHGANLPGTDEPLRALTSLLVHAGVFHLLLGMFTVAMVGGLLERELGPALVIPVFLVSGAAGALASDWLGRDGLGVGAAAGVAGLIGAGAVIGQRAGTRRGLTYRNELLSVGVLVIGFGLFVKTDYRAILPAAAVGAVCGRFLTRDLLDGRPWASRLIGLAGAAALVALAVIAAGAMLPARDPSTLAPF
jgi:membrane associated rhomboid family serine protease